MDSSLDLAAGPERPASAAQPRLGADAMVTEAVVEQVMQALARVTPVAPDTATAHHGAEGPFERPQCSRTMICGPLAIVR